MALQPGSALLISGIMGKYLHKVGRKFGIVGGLLTTMVGLGVLSICEFVNLVPFIIFSLAGRFLCGVGMGSFTTAAYAHFSSEYPDRI